MEKCHHNWMTMIISPCHSEKFSGSGGGGRGALRLNNEVQCHSHTRVNRIKYWRRDEHPLLHVVRLTIWSKECPVVMHSDASQAETGAEKDPWNIQKHSNRHGERILGSMESGSSSAQSLSVCELKSRTAFVHFNWILNALSDSSSSADELWSLWMTLNGSS